MLIRLRELGLLNEIAYNRLEFFWEQRRQLPNSLPEFIERLEGRVPAGFHEKAVETLLNETAGVFATHPTPAERIRKARQQGKPGVFEMEMPSRLLFNDFDRLSQTVTSRHYLHSFGLAPPASALVPASDFLK